MVALTLHRLVVRRCACLPVPSRPTWCRLSPCWPGVGDDASTKQCAMCSGCVEWEASCHQTACSLSLWVRRLWNLVTHTQVSHTIFHTHIILSHTSFTQLHHTQLFTYNFLTSRSSTTSFVFPSFPVPLKLLFLLIGRSWLVGLSGLLIFGPALWPRNNSQCQQPVALWYFNIFYLCNFTLPGRHSRRGGPKCRRPECPAELHWFGAS